MRKGATIVLITDDNDTVARFNSENVTVAGGESMTCPPCPFFGRSRAYEAIYDGI